MNFFFFAASLTFAYNLHSIWLINSKASLLLIIKIITIAQIVETGRKRITTITTKNDDVLWFFWATSKLNCWRIIVRWTLTNSLKLTQKVPEHDTQLSSACITQPHQTSTILQWLALSYSTFQDKHQQYLHYQGLQGLICRLWVLKGNQGSLDKHYFSERDEEASSHISALKISLVCK